MYMGVKWIKKTDSLRIKCDKRNCEYWTHVKCIGFFFQNKDKEEEFANTVSFYWSAHIPKPPLKNYNAEIQITNTEANYQKNKILVLF